MNRNIHPQAGDYHARREELKEIYRINDAWKDLGFEGEPAKSCRCPWREDHKPSFSVYNEGRSFKDFSTDDSGNVFNFVMLALGASFKEAIEWIEERNGGHSYRIATRVPRHRHPSPPKPRKELKLPTLNRGKTSDIKQLSKSRRITPYSLNIAVEIGTLRFGTVCGKRSWILTDPSRKLAEARRLDGKPFDAVGTLPARKAHTLAGSSKSWPFGLSLTKGMATPGAMILLVEGGPDYLAAFDFLTRFQRQGFQPVAMLGKSNRIPADALELMAGRRVRIYPHHDPGGGGMQAAQDWHSQLFEAGCKVDGFGFAGFTRIDGKPVTDLNDFLLADGTSREAWKGLLP